MWFTLAALVILVVVVDIFIIFILPAHIDILFETRLSIKVNCRYTCLRHLSVFDLDDLQ